MHHPWSLPCFLYTTHFRVLHNLDTLHTGVHHVTYNPLAWHHRSPYGTVSPFALRQQYPCASPSRHSKNIRKLLAQASSTRSRHLSKICENTLLRQAGRGPDTSPKPVRWYLGPHYTHDTDTGAVTASQELYINKLQNFDTS